MSSTFDDSIWELVPDVPRPADPWLAGLARDFSAGAEAVLDLGCGDGIYLPVLAEFAGSVHGADRSQIALDRAARRCPEAGLTLVGADERIPLGDNGFDRVWCCDTLEHVLDTQTVLSEARRVLKPSGELFVATPDHSFAARLRLAFSGWDRHFDPFSPHLRFYTSGSLGLALTECGFELPRVSRRGGVLVAFADRL